MTGQQHDARRIATAPRAVVQQEDARHNGSSTHRRVMPWLAPFALAALYLAELWREGAAQEPIGLAARVVLVAPLVVAAGVLLAIVEPAARADALTARLQPWLVWTPRVRAHPALRAPTMAPTGCGARSPMWTGGNRLSSWRVYPRLIGGSQGRKGGRRPCAHRSAPAGRRHDGAIPDGGRRARGGTPPGLDHRAAAGG
jgi:hypothetical protein